MTHLPNPPPADKQLIVGSARAHCQGLASRSCDTLRDDGLPRRWTALGRPLRWRSSPEGSAAVKRSIKGKNEIFLLTPRRTFKTTTAAVEKSRQFLAFLTINLRKHVAYKQTSQKTLGETLRCHATVGKGHNADINRRQLLKINHTEIKRAQILPHFHIFWLFWSTVTISV